MFNLHILTSADPNLAITLAPFTLSEAEQRISLDHSLPPSIAFGSIYSLPGASNGGQLITSILLATIDCWLDPANHTYTKKSKPTFSLPEHTAPHSAVTSSTNSAHSVNIRAVYCEMLQGTGGTNVGLGLSPLRSIRPSEGATPLGFWTFMISILWGEMRVI